MKKFVVFLMIFSFICGCTIPVFADREDYFKYDYDLDDDYEYDFDDSDFEYDFDDDDYYKYDYYRYRKYRNLHRRSRRLYRRCHIIHHIIDATGNLIFWD